MFFKKLWYEIDANDPKIFAIATLLSQVFPLISAPILSREYDPVSFGIYAIYYSTNLILGSIFILSLHNAILSEAEEGSAYTAFQAALIPPTLLSAFLLCFLIKNDQLAVQYHFLIELGNGKLLLPLTILLSSYYMSGYTLLLRRGNYRILAQNKIILSFSTMVYQIIIGIMGLGAIGLVIANLMGYITAIALIAKEIIKYSDPKNFSFNFHRIYTIYKKYVNLMIYTTLAGLVNCIGSSVPDFLIKYYLGPVVLGEYSVGSRLVNAPVSFISTSLQDVFRKEIASEALDKYNARNVFKKYLIFAFGAMLCILLPLLIELPHILNVILGRRWVAGATYIQSTEWLILIRFVASPLSYVWIIKGKQKADFIWQIGLVILTLCSFVIPYIFYDEYDPKIIFLIYSSVVGSWYLLNLIISYKLVSC